MVQFEIFRVLKVLGLIPEEMSQWEEHECVGSACLSGAGGSCERPTKETIHRLVRKSWIVIAKN